MADQFGKMKPLAVIGALAVVPDRFVAAFVENSRLTPDEAAALVDADGRSLLDMASSTTNILTKMRYEISAAANRDNAVLKSHATHPEILEDVAAIGDRNAELTRLREANDKLLEVMKVMSVKDWGRVNVVDGHEPASVLQVGQAIVRRVTVEVVKAEALGSQA